MTGVSLVLTGMLTPSCGQLIRDAKQTNSDKHAYKSDDIRVIEVSEKLEFLNIHCQTAPSAIRERVQSHLPLTCVQLSSEFCDGHSPSFQLADKHVLEPTTPDLVQLYDLVGWDFPIVQTQALQI